MVCGLEALAIINEEKAKKEEENRRRILAEEQEKRKYILERIERTQNFCENEFSSYVLDELKRGASSITFLITNSCRYEGICDFYIYSIGCYANGESAYDYLRDKDGRDVYHIHWETFLNYITTHCWKVDYCKEVYERIYGLGRNNLAIKYKIVPSPSCI